MTPSVNTSFSNMTCKTKVAVPSSSGTTARCSGQIDKRAEGKRISGFVRTSYHRGRPRTKPKSLAVWNVWTYLIEKVTTDQKEELVTRESQNV
ncbi:hypothetical protein ElyMa_001381600 [Elysia marginata]|uniref:Uncharacterized protein n=1 Tax=Elysia marginata TaxID=1093978 RepID=A0AAV4IQZ7_9GAST|nr:hypothetical protein ElyMa_001381600 [Elysia marginata]